MYNAGDFQGTETAVMIPFNAFTSDDPSASVTVTDLVAGDVVIFKDGSLTQRSSAAGVAVDIDVDTNVGMHWITIDLTDNTDAGFYAAGSQYLVGLVGITVDGATLNPIIGGFTIGKMQIAANAALVALALDHLLAVADADDVVNDSVVGKLASTDGDWSNFAKATDSLQSVRDKLTDIETDTDVIDDGTSGLVKIAQDVAAVLVDTGTTLQGEVDAIQAAVITNAAGADVAADIIALKAVADAIPTTAMRGTDSAALASVCTEARLAELDAANLPADVDGLTAAVITNAAGTDVAADIIAIKAVIDNLRAGAIRKNVAFSDFEFVMVLAADHVTPATGKTVTAERSIDGGAFASVGGTIAEVSNGIYQFDAAQADTNGAMITWRFSETDCDDFFFTFRTVT